jgi:chromosome segregation ATPase
MYGDTLVMRRRAGQLREQGADIRAAADQLVARSEAIPWRGRAAEAMRERVKERAHHLRAAAHAHDTAAESLERHLAEVDRVKESIAESERALSGRLADARARVDRDAAGPGDGASSTEHDRILAAVEPPSSGHADWLALELPGS